MNPMNQTTNSLRDRTRAFAMTRFDTQTYVRCSQVLNELQAFVRENLRDVPEHRSIRAPMPLVYIAQPTRSGGTLLRNLFDGHSSYEPTSCIQMLKGCA
jgi:hypothetical protein